jgi:hypothetical protein
VSGINHQFTPACIEQYRHRTRLSHYVALFNQLLPGSSLAGHWPDREIAVSLNRMRCKTGDGETWTTVRVKEMRERLGLAECGSSRNEETMISLMKAAERLGICVGSAKSLVLRGILPATQVVPGSPWLVPVDALASEAVHPGVQQVIARRPKIYEDYQYDKLIRLPGI